MVFNSLTFFWFFATVFFIYYLLGKKSKEVQNVILLVASYFFYGYVSWKLAGILVATTLLFFFLGKAISKAPTLKRSSQLANFGVVLGLSLLGYFKYLNFFIESFRDFFALLGWEISLQTLDIIAPIGISYFTFKVVSYVLEIHRKKTEASTNLVAFSTYIAFFPTILSGPIDRPNGFLPQLEKKRTFDYATIVDGMRQFLWGLFQKLVIADNLSVGVDHVWENMGHYSSISLAFTAILYSVQLYTDFSGYSHMAIGVGKMLGLKITRNFNYPFFSRNIAEFWRNWHMSLTSWLTDYVFMPLNIRFRDWENKGIILAIFINMFFVGLWHGANWTFIVFGIYHGLLFIPLIYSGAMFKKKKLKPNKWGLPIFKDALKIFTTFLWATGSFIIFKASNMTAAFNYYKSMFMQPISGDFEFLSSASYHPIFFIIILFFVVEWRGRKGEHGLAILCEQLSRPKRWLLYALIIFLMGMYMPTTESTFIYFQF